MSIDFNDVQGDQHVYTSDGAEIGRPGGIYCDPATGIRYLKVDRMRLMGLFGGESLFVPESAIERVDMAQEIIRLKVPKAEAEAEYVNKPGTLRPGTA